jgi:hypothetical protein
MSQDVVDSVLTPEEREWAFALEEALYGNDAGRNDGAKRRAFRRSQRQSWVERVNTNSNNPYVSMPTDFELATHAMIAKGNTHKAIRRIKRLAAFKELYRVPDFESDEDHPETTEANVEAVLLLVKKFLVAYPEFIKSVGMDKHGRVTMVIRLRGLRWSHPPPFNHTEADRFRALYCLLNALQPTVESVRRGTVWIADLGGVAERPDAAFLEGIRKLLRDAYPIRVEDVPVVRCPPLWSGAFCATRPFWSRHFGQKFVRVDSGTLKMHFPPELLAGARPNHHQNQAKEPQLASMPKHRRIAHRKKVAAARGNGGRDTSNKSKPRAVVAANGDRYDNTWENLDDDGGNDSDEDEEEQEESSEWNEWTTFEDGNAEEVIGKSNINDEIWDKIERLVRMRFETERTFRVA